MPERGKCQACGRFEALESVELRVAGRKYFGRDLCRRCACVLEMFTDQFHRIAPQ